MSRWRIQRVLVVHAADTFTHVSASDEQGLSHGHIMTWEAVVKQSNGLSAVYVLPGIKGASSSPTHGQLLKETQHCG